MADASTVKMELKSPMAGKLNFLSMQGSETLSRPFEYQIVALAKSDVEVKFDDLLGKPAQVNVGAAGGTPRPYHGIVTAVAFDGTVGSWLSWRLTVRPWLWLLTRSANVRIFQKLSVPDILKKVLEPYAGSFDSQLSGKYRKREYCVQYRESDFDFASRLMEEEGIFYFFKHEDGKHTLVMGDAAKVHVAMQGLSTLEYRDDAEPEVHLEQASRWRFGSEIRSGKSSVRDHSYLAPAQTHEKSQTGDAKHAHGKLEVYDYPAGLPTYPDESATGGLPDEADAIAKRRLEELRSAHATVHGLSSSPRLCTGARFKLAKHPLAAQNAEYIVLSTRVKMRLSGYEGGASDLTQHQCEFSAFESKLPFRPARITPRPRVAGPQTATVVGKAGEEIFVDKHGRVKLQFHWDREGKKNDESSCFVRVAQPAAGKGWGVVFLPRIGQEVVVDFLEGDPDQPLVTGGVYNADNKLPYPLPDKATVSTIKSRSSKGGGAKDFNELRFDDAKGKEYLLIQAQKDQHEFVKNSLWTQIGNEQHHTVKKKRLQKIEDEDHLSVAKDQKIKIDGKFHQTVAQDMMLATDGKHNLKAAQDITAESGTAYSIKAGTDLHIKVGMNAGMEGGMNVHIKGGMNVVVEAGLQLTLKGGSGSVVLGPDGVSITGPLVKINSGGSPGSGSGAKPVKPAKPDKPEDPKAPVDPLSHI